MQKHNQYNINFDGYRFYPNVLLISSAVAGPVFYEEKLGYMFREINICSACKTNTKHIGKPIQHEFTESGTVHRKWRYLSNDTIDARTLAHELQARSVRPDFQKYRMLNRDELKTDGRTNPDERSGIGRRLTLRHTFSSELCGGQPGHTANHNLMDYGFGTGLNRFQWEAIHNPAIIGKVFQSDEDGASLATCTLEKLFDFYSANTLELKDYQNDFDYIFNNYDDLYQQLEDNTEASSPIEEIANVGNWSVRASSISKNAKGYLYERILKKIEDSANDNNIGFSLHNRGIYLGKAKISGVEMNLAIYSVIEDISITKVFAPDYCALIDDPVVNSSIKVADFGSYLLLGFYKEEALQMIIQVMTEVDIVMEDLLITFSILNGEFEIEDIEDNEPDFPITVDNLEEIFPGTDTEILQQVVDAINKYSDHFEINTLNKLSHFIGQIGVESGSLKQLQESGGFSSTRRIVEVYPQAKYGHMYQKAVFNDNEYKYNYIDINFDVNDCVNDIHNGEVYNDGDGICTKGTGRAPDISNDFPYIDQDQVRNAFGSIKNVEKKTPEGRDYKKFPESLRSDITKGNFTDMVSEFYAEGLIKIKPDLIESTDLYDIVYACKNGNGTISSKDGSTFRGAGLIQITGKGNFYDISIEWNKDPENENNKKYFYKKAPYGHFEELISDYDIAVKASMYFWKMKNLNNLANSGVDETTIDAIGKIVNGSDGLPNHYKERRTKTTDAYKALKPENPE